MILYCKYGYVTYVGTRTTTEKKINDVKVYARLNVSIDYMQVLFYLICAMLNG